MIDNPQDYLVGVQVTMTPGTAPLGVDFNWSRHRVDCDLSMLADDTIQRLNREYEAQIGQLRNQGGNGWNREDWYALAPDADEKERIMKELEELGANPATQEISPPESVVTAANEHRVVDKAELEFYLNR